jgi:hypothetical protein
MARLLRSVRAAGRATRGSEGAAQLPVRRTGIAEALHAVGAGATYMRASRVARDRARRFRVDPETGEVRESDRGQLVADWVELFAAVVFEPHRPRAWPAEGSLLLDHLPFRVRALDASGKRIPAGRVAFDVLCAAGYHAGKPRRWRAEWFPTAYPADWSSFQGALPGAPTRIVCDAHSGMLRAIAERWPQVGTTSMRMAPAACA